MKEYKILRLAKSEDLNHHGTLFAGRTAEWLVEAGFITAASEYGCQDMFCVNVHGFTFRKPVLAGEILTISGRIARAGSSSLMVHVRGTGSADDVVNVEGFITFVCVEHGTTKSKAHGITLDEPADEEEAESRKTAEEIWRISQR